MVDFIFIFIFFASFVFGESQLLGCHPFVLVYPNS
jgi:hypothetical protein